MLLGGCERSFENPSDPGASRFETRSEAFLRRVGESDPVEGDTVRFVGGITSAPVEADGLVETYAWDLDGDGTADTAAAGTDTLSFIAAGPGIRKVGLTLTDKAGRTDAARLVYTVHPSLGRLFRIKGFAKDCPAYAQEPVLMRIALALSHFAVERTREEGFGSAEFALKLAQALTGSAFPLDVLSGFDFSFSRGVYHFRNGGFALDVAFHYGSGMPGGPGAPGHAEGDTILSNLFDFDSYIKGYSYTVFPPSFKYTRGPLAELIEGDIDVDASDPADPKFDFRVDFNRIRMSFARSASTLLVLSNQEITLANALFFARYEGKARMAPVYPPDLIRLYGQDSLELDFAGTKVISPELPLAWPYEEDGVKDTAVYRLSLAQETLRQAYRFGEAGGVKKVFGDYAAVNRLGEGNEALEAVYFKGGYSSTSPDTARFYCKESMDAPEFFGAAAFETAVPGRGAFASERYGYDFGFPFSTVETWKGATSDLPPALRE